MKISGLVIQNRNISEHTEREFHAKYKGCSINISSTHGYGYASSNRLIRYGIAVTDKRGVLIVKKCNDCLNMRYAIQFAIDGAML